MESIEEVIGMKIYVNFSQRRIVLKEKERAMTKFKSTYSLAVQLFKDPTRITSWGFALTNAFLLSCLTSIPCISSHREPRAVVVSCRLPSEVLSSIIILYAFLQLSILSR